MKIKNPDDKLVLIIATDVNLSHNPKKIKCPVNVQSELSKKMKMQYEEMMKFEGRFLNTRFDLY